jgi:hypothetical protein
MASCWYVKCNHNRQRPLSRQSATKAITKNIPTFIITKSKQVTIFIKNQNCFIYWLILAIVCTMVKVYQSSIPPSWVRGYSQNAANQRERRTRSSYIEYHGQTMPQLFSFYHSEPLASTRGTCYHNKAEAE